jgi:hypothetical protein
MLDGRNPFDEMRSVCDKAGSNPGDVSRGKSKEEQLDELSKKNPEIYNKFRYTKELCVTNADIVVTEGPYLRGDAKKYYYRGHVDIFKKLCFAVCMISVIAAVLKAELVLIQPVDWKT